MTSEGFIVAIVAAIVVAVVASILGWIFRRRLRVSVRNVLLRLAHAPRVSRDQAEDNGVFMARIHSLRPRTAKSIEFSAVNVKDILNALKQEECRILLLVKHPDSVSVFQRNRIFSRLDDLLSVDFANYPYGIEVRCYRSNASLRGRMLDDRVANVGWYTPTETLDLSGIPIEILGHSNPLVTADASTPQGQALKTMFDRVWEELWKSGQTEDARAVLARRVVGNP